MDAKVLKDDIIIKLNKDESLVLFEWLGSFNEVEHLNLFQDQAEERILYDLEAALEKVLSEPFSSNYNELLSQARENIRDKE